MESSTKCQLLLSLIFYLITATQSQYFFCSEANSLNTTYQQNINGVLSSITSSENRKGYGFYISSYGQSPEKLYAMGLCRGDLKPDTCVTCLKSAANRFPDGCSNTTEATTWTDDCKLRYSNHSMNGTLELDPYVITSNGNGNLSSSPEVLEGFNKRLTAFLGPLKTRAAGGGDLLKFAVGNASVNIYAANVSTIYGLAQCGPDLSESDCNRCLDDGSEKIRKFCYGTGLGNYANPSCNLRYELDHIFFDPAAQTVPVTLAPLGPPISNAKGKKIDKSRTLMAILAPLLLSIINFL